MDGTVFMGDLLKRYESAPIAYGEYKENHIAVITHTSGSTKGTRKPLPYSDRAVNAANARQKDASIPGLNMPGLDLQKLLQMEASPKALEGLQKDLDMVFDAYTGQKQA